MLLLHTNQTSLSRRCALVGFFIFKRYWKVILVQKILEQIRKPCFEKLLVKDGC
jgi:hypothetical protein